MNARNEGEIFKESPRKVITYCFGKIKSVFTENRTDGVERFPKAFLFHGIFLTVF